MDDVQAARAERKEVLREKLRTTAIISTPIGLAAPLDSEVERIIAVVSEWLWSE